MLEIKQLTKRFGGNVVVAGLDMTVEKGEIVGLIGPNGAGKTTLFNLITGFLQPTKGKIIFEGHDITGKKPHFIANRGIVRTFQLASIFPTFSVLKNIVAASYMYSKTGFWEAALHTPNSRKKEEVVLERAREILKFTGLDSQQDKIAEELSSGWRRTLAIGVALATNPRLLLLDEPVTTLDPERVKFIMNLVAKVKESGVTVLIIEHNMRVIMDYCDRIVVLASGKKIAEGTHDEIRKNKDVIISYLGE